MRHQIHQHYDKIGRYVSFIAFFIVSYLLAKRNIYAALDDESYISHFSGYIFSSNEGILFFIEEPLWKFYALSLGEFLGAEYALRLTIFLSSFSFLWYTYRFCKRGSLYILLIFIFSFQLSTQLYFNQIRQGFALSIFIFGLSRGKNFGFIFSIISSLIHSSFIFVSFVYLYSLLSEKNRNWRFVFLISLLLFYIILSKIIPNWNNNFEILGRRASVYDFEQKLNFNFFLLFVPNYILILYISYKNIFNDIGRFFWHFSLAFSGFVILFTFFFDAGRLLYFFYIFFPILLINSFQNSLIRMIEIYWLLFNIIFNLYQYYKEYPIVNDTLYGRWLLIL
jgi:hypothetical protein